jgi:hypothetical protein
MSAVYPLFFRRRLQSRVAVKTWSGAAAMPCVAGSDGRACSASAPRNTFEFAEIGNDRSVRIEIDYVFETGCERD